MRSFCRKTHVHKIPPFRGGGILGFGGGGSADFIFYGREDFSELEKWCSPEFVWEIGFLPLLVLTRRRLGTGKSQYW